LGQSLGTLDEWGFFESDSIIFWPTMNLFSHWKLIKKLKGCIHNRTLSLKSSSHLEHVHNLKFNKGYLLVVVLLDFLFFFLETFFIINNVYISILPKNWPKLNFEKKLGRSLSTLDECNFFGGDSIIFWPMMNLFFSLEINLTFKKMYSH